MADTQAKIVLAAEDRTARVFAGLKSNLGAVRTQVDATNQSFIGLSPAILGAFSIVGISAFFGKVVDGIDKLNDLADATGSSVESLSGLEDIGARTGTSIDTIGSAVIKLNKNLLDARDPTSEAAQLFKALGLNAAELSKADPSEALLRVSTALNGFANNGERSQFQIALLGKSTRELAPFLKDLAEAGKINATVTKQQADEAELFNKQLFQLQKNATDAAREIAGPIVASMNALIGRFQDARKEGEGLFGFLGREYARVTKEQLALLGLGGAAPGRQKVSGIVTGPPEPAKPTITLPDPPKPKGGGGSTKDRLTDAQRYLENLQRQLQGTQDLSVAETVLADIQAGRLKLAKGESAQPLLDIAQKIDMAKRQADQLKAETEQVRELRAEQEKLKAAGLAVFEATRTPREKLDADLASLGDLYEKNAISADTYGRRVIALNDELDKQGVQLAAELTRAKELFDKGSLSTEAYKQEVERLNAEFEKLGQVPPILQEIDTFAVRAKENIQDALGEELSNVLEGNFKNIGASFTQMLNRMVAEAAAAELMKALFGSGLKQGGAGGGGILSGLFNAGLSFFTGGSTNDGNKGGINGGSVILPNSLRGGAATGTNLLERDMITLLHKGEAVVPREYNPAAGGRGAGGVTVVINQSFAAGTSRATSLQAAADARMAFERAGRNL